MILILLCLYIGLVISVPPTVPPKRCCVDHQYEITLAEFGGSVGLDGVPTLINGYSLMSYDYYAKLMKLEMHMFSQDGNETVSRILYDYKGGKEYVMSDAGCSLVFTSGSMVSPCVPNHAIYKDSTTFGYGDKTLKVNRWQFKQGNNTVVLSVTDDGCVPFSQTMYGTSNNATSDVVYFFSNFKPGIKDRSVFTVPRNCMPGGKALGLVGRTVRAAETIF